jgi:hypothetical protein
MTREDSHIFRRRGSILFPRISVKKMIQKGSTETLNNPLIWNAANIRNLYDMMYLGISKRVHVWSLAIDSSDVLYVDSYPHIATLAKNLTRPAFHAELTK